MVSNDIFVWLCEGTLIATALAVVIMLTREHISQYIGARGAVLLWSIPAVRLAMPPLPKLLGTQPNPPASAELAAATDPIIVNVGMSPEAVYTPIIDPSPIGAASFLPQATLETTIAYVLMIWALGATIYLARTVLETRQWHLTVTRESTSTARDVMTLVKTCVNDLSLRRHPIILTSKAAKTPQLIGLFRPTIVLPIDFSRRYTPFEQRHALLHELIHFRRHDVATAWIATTLAAVQWFNPLAQRSLKLFRIDQEYACDEAVCAAGIAPQDYATTLLKTASLGLTPATALTLNHGLCNRMKKLGNPTPSPLLLRTAIIAISAAALSSAVSTASTFDIQDTKKQDATTPVQIETIDIREIDTQSADGKEKRRVKVIIHTDDAGTITELGDQSVHIIKSGDGVKNSFSFTSSDHNNNLILVGDPFSSIEPPEPTTLKIIEMPAPPTPPTEPPSPAPQPVEGGTWMFIPDTPDMKELEVEMALYSKSMEEFEPEMEEFEIKMGEFAKKIEKVSFVITKLAERCDKHLSKSNAPTLLTENNPEARKKIRALCVADGDKAPSKKKIHRFIDRQSNLTKAEKDELKREERWR